MTQLVTFNRAMRGIGNPALIDNDDLIVELIAQGVVVKVETWPPAPDDKNEADPKKSRLRIPRGRYLTK